MTNFHLRAPKPVIDTNTALVSSNRSQSYQKRTIAPISNAFLSNTRIDNETNQVLTREKLNFNRSMIAATASAALLATPFLGVTQSGRLINAPYELGGSLRPHVPDGYTAPMTGQRYDMQRQIDQFMGQLPTLLAQYAGRYVAFEDGRVLAAGDAIAPVLAEVDAIRGEVRPVLIRRVQPDYPPIEL